MKQFLVMMMLAAMLMGPSTYAQDSALVSDSQDGTDQADDRGDDTSSKAVADNGAPAGKAKKAGKGRGKKKGKKKNKKEAGSATQEMVRKLRNQDGAKTKYKQLMMAINRQATLHSFGNLLRSTGLNHPLRAYNFVKSPDAIRGKRAKKYLDLIPLGTELTVFAPEAIKIEQLIQEIVRANQALRGKDKEAGKKQHAEVMKKVTQQLEGCIVKGRYLFADLPDELTTLAGSKIEPKKMMFSRKDIIAGNGVLFVAGHVQADMTRAGGKRSVTAAVAQIKDRIKARNAAVLQQEHAHHDAIKAFAHKDDPKPDQADDTKAASSGAPSPDDSNDDAEPAATADDKAATDTAPTATTPAPAGGNAAMPGTTATAHGGTSTPADDASTDDASDDDSIDAV